MENKDESSEMKLFQKIFDIAKVYIVPGAEFNCNIAGWFRIIFAVRPEVLEEGLNRLEKLLQSIKNQNNLSMQ